MNAVVIYVNPPYQPNYLERLKDMGIEVVIEPNDDLEDGFDFEFSGDLEDDLELSRKATVVVEAFQNHCRELRY